MTDPHYERRDVTDGPVGLAALSLGVLIAVGLGMAALARWALDAPPEHAPGAVGTWQPGDAPLPSDELTEQRLAIEAAWDARAAAWEWVDAERDVARIPVDRAAELLLASGFPARDGGADD